MVAVHILRIFVVNILMLTVVIFPKLPFKSSHDIHIIVYVHRYVCKYMCTYFPEHLRGIVLSYSPYIPTYPYARVHNI